MTTHKTRSFERPKLPVFQASCPCGWVGREWSFEAPAREEQTEHRCEQ